MSDRPCIRGCTRPGVHYATCVDFGKSDGECKGCAPVEARDGVLLCDRCYGRLRRRIEAAPDLVGHLRSLADPLKATAYDRVRVQSSGSDGSPAPVSVELIDAADDIMHVLGAKKLEPGCASDVAYEQAYDEVWLILAGFDRLANSLDVLEWWRLVMSPVLEENPEFWTISRALSRWPLEDRRTRANQPCPECGLRSVTVTPPRSQFARTWFVCQSCGWRKTERDDDGLWAAAFGQYADTGHDEGSNMAERNGVSVARNKLARRDIDVSGVVKTGIEYVIDHAEQVEAIGVLGVPTAAIVGATPLLAEQFALLADDIARQVRGNYENGVLIAGGARLVAAAIRASVEGGTVLEDLAASATAKPVEVTA